MSHTASPPPPTAQHHLRPNLLTNLQARELARGEEVELGDEEGGGGGHCGLWMRRLNGWLCDIEIAKVFLSVFWGECCWGYGT